MQAVHRVRAARARVAVADQAITVARDNVRAEEALFRGGRTTNFSVFQRQGELEDAELRKVRAIADYQEAVASLELVTGDILTAYRVDVAGAIDGDGDGR